MKPLEGELAVLLCCFTLKYSHSEDIMNSLKGKHLNSLPRTIYDASIYDASSQMQLLVTSVSLATKKGDERNNLNVRQQVKG